MTIRINSIDDEVPFWFEQAIAYYEASKILLDSSSEYKIFPIITLQAFSVECSLKYLLLCKLGKNKFGHNLYELFNELPENIKDDICNNFNSIYGADFNQDIIEISKDFIDSRYYFDGFKKSYFGKSFSNGCLNAIANFLIEYAKNHEKF
jgi:HEPN domain-containing protein